MWISTADRQRVCRKRPREVNHGSSSNLNCYMRCLFVIAKAKCRINTSFWSCSEMNTKTSVSQQTQNVIDQNKIQQFMNKAVGDIAGNSTAMLVIIGHRLGLYRAMAQANGPVSVKELADKTGTVERLVTEWLANQVASGYIEYDPSSRKYRLPPEHALALADENNPIYLQGIFKAIKSYFVDGS